MEKIYIEVFIPGINKNYDVVVSPDLSIKEAAQFIFRTISEFEMLKLDSDNLMLCDPKSKKIYASNLLLSQCNVKDGSKLILV